MENSTTIYCIYCGEECLGLSVSTFSGQMACSHSCATKFENKVPLMAESTVIQMPDFQLIPHFPIKAPQRRVAAR